MTRVRLLRAIIAARRPILAAAIAAAGPLARPVTPTTGTSGDPDA